MRRAEHFEPYTYSNVCTYSLITNFQYRDLWGFVFSNEWYYDEQKIEE